MNIVTLDISQGLTDHELGAGEYLVLLEAPALANVTIKASTQFGNGIPIKVGYDAKSRDNVDQWYVSSDPVIGGTIKFLMSSVNDPFTIGVVPSSIDVETIGQITNFSAALLANLDKISNPFIDTLTTALSTSATTETTILSTTCTFDEIDIFANSGILPLGASAAVYITLDGVVVFRQNRQNPTTYGGEGSTKTELIQLKNTLGKALIISAYNTGGYSCTVTLNKRTKKA